MGDRLAAAVERIKRWGPVRLVVEYGDSHAGAYAAGLAFNAFLSMFPLILGLLTIVGLTLGNLGVRSEVEKIIVSTFPTATARQEVHQALAGFHQHAGLFGLVAVAGLIWTGIGFFGSMEFAFDQLHGVRMRGFVRQKVMGLVMMALFLVGILVSVGASAAIAFLPAVPFLGFLVGWAALVGLLAAIYKVVPNLTIPLGEVWPGALLAGLLIEALDLGFPLYAAHASGAGTYGQAFALFFLLAAWLYLMSQFLLLGLVLNRMLGGHRARLVVVPGGERGVG